MDERIYLKVKLKSLAEEARIIRLETKRAKRQSIKNGLYLHRIGIVKFEARHTHLAYGFLRGKEYNQIEKKAYEQPNWDKVRKMIQKYGSHYERGLSIDDPCNYKNSQRHLEETLKRFEEWIKRAQQKVTV